jgi:hypothetical protein
MMPAFWIIFTWVKKVVSAQPTQTVLEEQCRQKMLAWELEPSAEMVGSLAGSLANFDAGIIDILLTGQLTGGTDLTRTLQSIRCPAVFLQADQSAGGAMWDKRCRSGPRQLLDSSGGQARRRQSRYSRAAYRDIRAYRAVQGNADYFRYIINLDQAS